MSPDSKFIPLDALLDFSGKRALVTGGAMGIGRAVACRLAEAGAFVTIIDINEEKGRSAAENINADGLKADFIKCDVASEEEIKNTVAKSILNMGGIDILVNNAGIFPVTPFSELSSADINRIMDINFKGLVYFCRECSRDMIKREKSGCIVNLASVGGLHPAQKYQSIYEASKGAVITLTRSLALELGEYNIRVNALAPGGILTEGVLGQRSSGGGRAGLREFMARIPLGRMGTADDVARAALFLASELSGYMTGCTIPVDGGFLTS